MSWAYTRPAHAARYRAGLDELLAELEVVKGDPPVVAAARLGTTPAALARRLYRWGRPELARPFNAAAQRAQYAARTS